MLGKALNQIRAKWGNRTNTRFKPSDNDPCSSTKFKPDSFISFVYILVILSISFSANSLSPTSFDSLDFQALTAAILALNIVSAS